MASPDTLFAAESTSLDHAPSEKLIHRAEVLKKATDRVQKFGGYLIRAAQRRESGAAKKALQIAGVVEMLVEIPLTIMPLASYSASRQHRFNNLMIKEYPHVEGPPDISKIIIRKELKGGSSLSYADAVLAYATPEFLTTENHQLPPTQSSNPTGTESPAAAQIPHLPSNFHPITEAF